MLSFKPAFSFFSFTFIKRLFSSSSLPIIRVVSSAYLITYLLHMVGGIRGACLIHGLGRSPGEGECNPLQYSCLENPMDRGNWWATRVAKSWTWLKSLSMHTACFRVLFTKHRDCVTLKSSLPQPCFSLRSTEGIAQRLIKPLSSKEKFGLGSALMEKEMATHSSIPAWRIPWREEPGRLQSMGSQRVGHD